MKTLHNYFVMTSTQGGKETHSFIVRAPLLEDWQSRRATVFVGAVNRWANYHTKGDSAKKYPPRNGEAAGIAKRMARRERME